MKPKYKHIFLAGILALIFITALITVIATQDGNGFAALILMAFAFIHVAVVLSLIGYGVFKFLQKFISNWPNEFKL